MLHFLGVDARRIATLRNTRRSWPQIAKELGVGVGTVYRAYQELSKNPKADSFFKKPCFRVSGRGLVFSNLQLSKTASLAFPDTSDFGTKSPLSRG